MSKNSKARRDAKRKRRREAKLKVERGAIIEEDETLLPKDRELLDQDQIKGRAPDHPKPNATMQAPDFSHLTATRLSTGIRADHLVREAALWWDTRGRKAMGEMRRSQVRQARGQRTRHGPFTLNPDDPNFLPSGILHGWEWQRLNRAECIRVCMVYHSQKYEKPMLESERALLLAPAPIVH